MDTTNLILPLMEAAQSQKHVLFNEAIKMLDALLLLSVRSRVTATPPAAPADGDRYIVPAGALGAWTGTAVGTVTSYRDGSWHMHAPRAGWIARVLDENRSLVFNGSAWTADAGSGTFSELNISAAAAPGAALPASPPTGWWRVTLAGRSFRLPLYD